MAGGLNIVARDKDGKIKKDIDITRDLIKGKIVKIDELKKKEEKDANK